MGISRSAESLNYAAEIAQSLQILADPKKLQKAIEDLYGLPDIEKQKAQQAREDIAKNEAVLAGIKQGQEDLLKASQANVKADQALESKSAKLAEKEELLAKQLQEIAEGKSQLKLLSDNLSKREADILAKEGQIAKSLAEISQKQDEIEQYEASLKTKAAQLRGLTEGL